MSTSNPITAQALLSMPSHRKSMELIAGEPHIHAFPFNPNAGSRLLPAVENLRHEVDELIYESNDTQAYLLGALEGELVFALSVDKDSPSGTLTRCKSQLLLRLGLEGSGLTLEQQRLRGWIVGMLESIASTLNPEDWDNPTAT